MGLPASDALFFSAFCCSTLEQRELALLACWSAVPPGTRKWAGPVTTKLRPALLVFDGIDPADHGLFLAYYYEVGSACWLQLQERGLLSRVWLFGVSRDGVKVLNDSPRVHPQVQNPGALAVPLSSCAAFSFTRAFSKRHPLPPF